MPDEIRLPREGMSTLSAAFTRSYVEKIIRGIKSLRDKGKPEDQILKTLRDQLTDLDPFSLERVYKISLGETIPDDFAESMIAKETEIKPGTWKLEVKLVPPGVEMGTIVHHRGRACCVVRRDGAMVQLKALP